MRHSQSSNYLKGNKKIAFRAVSIKSPQEDNYQTGRFKSTYSADFASPDNKRHSTQGPRN